MTEQLKQQPTTEELILQAAEKEFLEKGYSGAKTTAIAEAAGVTHAMFHYYFRTKDKLFEKIVAEKMGQLKELMFAAIGNPDRPLKERIIQGVEDHFDFIAANPMLPRFLFNELYLNRDRIENAKSSIIAMASQCIGDLQSAIDNEAAQGDCRQADARMVLLDIISLNIFPFIVEPVLNGILASTNESFESLLEKRKKENVKTILGKLNLI